MTLIWKTVSLLPITLFITACTGTYKPTYVPPASGKIANIRLVGESSIIDEGDTFDFTLLDAPCDSQYALGSEIVRLGTKSRMFYPTITESVSTGMPMADMVEKNALFYETKIPAGRLTSIYIRYHNSKYRMTESCSWEVAFKPKNSGNYELTAIRDNNKCRLVAKEIILQSGKAKKKPLRGTLLNEGICAKLRKKQGLKTKP